MPNACHHRSPRPLPKAFRYGAAALLSTVLFFIGIAAAWADESITLDFVRHAEAGNNVPGLLDTVPPGEPLTEPAGDIQAQNLAIELAPENIYGAYASQFTEDQQTAMPLDLPVQILPGLNDIPGGIFDGLGVNDYTALSDVFGALYILGPLAWTLGLYFVPEVGDPGFNGATFEDLFGGAVQTIYDASAGNVGQITDAAFAAEASVAIWTLMNVNNPDFSLIFGEALDTGDFLPYTGIAVVQGEPGDWTLVSWNDTPVPADPGLPTELFVDVRDLITAPQMSAYNIWQAILTGDPATIVNALGQGGDEVATATVQFPLAVIRDVSNSLQDGFQNLGTELGSDTVFGVNLGDLSTDIANLLSTISTDMSGLSSNLSTMISDAVASL